MDGKTRISQLDTATNICSTGNFKPTDSSDSSSAYSHVASKSRITSDIKAISRNVQPAGLDCHLTSDESVTSNVHAA